MDFTELGRLMDERNRDLDKLADECDSEVKLAVTRWVMKHIVEHAKDGGSYRYLIYERLGFGPEAYAPLCGDGLTISNEFDLTQNEEVVEFLKNGDIEGAKKRLGRCDEPGCFEQVSCGWPSDNGYRSTCGDHYVGKLKKDV